MKEQPNNADRRPQARRRVAGAAALVLLAVLSGAAAQTTTTLVPGDWSLKPTGLGRGDTFRLLVLTKNKRTTGTSNINTYNSFVQSDVNSNGHSSIRDYSSLFKVLGCTGSVNARANTDTENGDVQAPIYWLNGNKVADNYADLYDGSWDSNQPRRSDGERTAITAAVATGCTPSGTSQQFLHLGVPANHAGQRIVTYGKPASSGDELNAGMAYQNSVSLNASFYGLSGIFEVDNFAPTAADTTLVVDGVYTFSADDFQYADRDNDDLAGVTVVSLPDSGILALDGTEMMAGQEVTKAELDEDKLTYTPAEDEEGDGRESFAFRVSDGSKDSADTYTMTLSGFPVITIAAVESPVAEGQAASFAFSRAGDVTDPLTINVFWDRFGVFLEPQPSSTVTFPANERTVTVAVQTVDNEIYSPGSQGSLGPFILPDTNDPPSYRVGNPGQALVQVTDDDPLPVVTLVLTPSTIAEDGGVSTVTATMDRPSSDNTNIEVSVESGAPVSLGRIKLLTIFAGKTENGKIIIDLGDGNEEQPPVTLTAQDNDVDAPDRQVQVMGTVRGSDGPANPDPVTLTITDDDEAPTSSDGEVTPNEDEAYAFKAADFSFDDGDGDTLARVRIATLPTPGTGVLALDGVAVSENDFIEKTAIDAGQFIYTPPADASGDDVASFKFRVNDGTQDSVDEYTMTINITSVNDAPAVADGIADQTATVDEAFTFTVPAGAFADVDGDSLQYSATKGDDTPLPAWLAFNAGTRTFMGMPGAGDVGTLAVKVTASDGALSASDVFNIVVGEAAPNSAPVFGEDELTRSVGENAGPGTNVGEPIPAATDGDGDALSYTMEGDDEASFDFDGSTRQITAKAGVAYDFEAKDAYTVRVKADDGKGGTDTVTVTINLTDVDEPPGAPDAPTVTATSGTTTSLDVIWAAPANDGRPPITSYDLRYCAGLPSDCRADGVFTDGPEDVTGMSAIITGLEEGTTYQVQVRANNAEGDSGWSDPGGGGTAAPANNAPTLENAIANQDATAGESFSFTIPADAFEDADGDPLDYTATLPNDDPLPAWLSFDDTTRTFEGTPGAGDAGTLTVKVSVSDGGGEASDEFDITITVEGPGACAAPDFGTRRHIWTGTVTVGSYTATVGQTNYGFDAVEGAGALDDTTFAIGARTHTIRTVVVVSGGSDDGALFLATSSLPGLTPAAVAALRLHVCDAAYGFSAAGASANREAFQWSLDLDWSTETTRRLYLSLPANRAGTGAPALSSDGAAVPGDTLSADPGGITDADGLPDTFAYQWVREDADGSNPEDITGETSSTYTLTNADVGKRVRVLVGFTDLLGSAETRTSGPWPSSGAVAEDPANPVRPNSPASGRPAVSGPAGGGAPRVGDTLTVDTSAIEDADGLPPEAGFGYQWIRGDADGSNREDIPGANAPAYTLAPGDAGKVMYVRVSFTDDGGATETVTSPPTAVVAARASGDSLPDIVADGRTVTITWDEALDPDSVPAPGDFEVQRTWLDGHDREVTTVTPIRRVRVGGSTVTLELDNRLHHEDVVRVSYTPGASPVRYVAAGEAPAFGNAAAENRTPDIEPPKVSLRDQVTVNGATLRITFPEPLDPGSVPAPEGFEVNTSFNVHRHEGILVERVSVSGRTVTLTLARAVGGEESVSVSYDLTGGNPIRDLAGNPSWTGGQFGADNRTPAGAAQGKTLTADGDAVTVVFDAALDAASAPGVEDFRVKLTHTGSDGRTLRTDTVLAHIRTVAVSGSTVRLTLHNRIDHDMTVRLSYVPGDPPLRFADGTAVSAFSNLPVENLTAGPAAQQNSDGEEQPAAAQQNSDGEEQPADAQQNSDGEEQPAAAQQNSDGEEQPADAQQNSDGEEQPADAQQNSDGEEQPADAQQNSDGEEQPADAQQNSDGEEQPADAQQNSDGEEQPAAGQQSSDEDEQPAAGQQNSDGEEQPAELPPLVVSVADARVQEGPGATLDFVVSLSRPAPEGRLLLVSFKTKDGTAVTGEDYVAFGGRTFIRPGETSTTISVKVLDDAHDEGTETMTLTISGPSEGRIGVGTATGTIENSDPMPRAWLGRFGRTVAEQVPDLLAARFEEAAPGDHRLTLGGRSLEVGALRAVLDDPARLYRSAPGERDVRDQGTPATPGVRETGETAGRPADGPSDYALVARYRPIHGGHDGEEGQVRHDGEESREATPLERAVYRLLVNRGRVQFDARQFLAQSSFHLSLTDLGKDAGETIETVRAAPDPAGRWSLWGRGALTRFRGVDEGVSLDGDVLTGLLGVDYAKGGWLAGAALAWHDGDGAYRAAGAAGSGDLDSTLITVNPYLRYAFTDRLSAWGTLGYGTGSLALAPSAGEVIETDLGMAMGALGLRGVVYAGAATELAVKTDALWVRTSSAATQGLQSADADTRRVRLLLSGQHRRALADDALLIPNFELGLRYDAGDAETGFGLELGGGLQYADSVRGLRIETKARALLAHEDNAYREWGISGSVSLDPGRLGRGLALRLASGWGMADSGARALWQRQGATGIAPRHDAPMRGRLTAELGYGLDVPWTHGILTPYSGMEWAGARRTLTLGWRFTLGQSLSLSLDGERRENGYEPPDYSLMLNTFLPW